MPESIPFGAMDRLKLTNVGMATQVEGGEQLTISCGYPHFGSPRVLTTSALQVGLDGPGWLRNRVGGPRVGAGGDPGRVEAGWGQMEEQGVRMACGQVHLRTLRALIK